ACGGQAILYGRREVARRTGQAAMPSRRCNYRGRRRTRTARRREPRPRTARLRANGTHRHASNRDQRRSGLAAIGRNQGRFDPSNQIHAGASWSELFSSGDCRRRQMTMSTETNMQPGSQVPIKSRPVVIAYAPNAKGRKGTLTAELDGAPIHIDNTVDPANDKDRRRFINALVEIVPNLDVGDARTQLVKLADKVVTQTNPPPPSSNKPNSGVNPEPESH